MAITVASWASYNAGTIGTGSANPSVSVSPPTGLAAGDTWVIVVCDWNGTSDAYTAPSGFTKVPTTGTWDDSTSGNCGSVLFYKANCTGAETAVTVTETIASGGMFACGAWRHSGAATSSPFVDLTDGAFSVEYSGGAITYTVSTNAAHTPAQANEVVYFIANTGSGGETNAGGMGWSTPSGWTKLGQADHDTSAATSNAGDPTALVVFYQVQTTATSVPITSTTCTPPGHAKFAGGAVGVEVSFYAAAAIQSFPAGYNLLGYQLQNAVYRM